MGRCPYLFGINPLALQAILRSFPSDEVMTVEWKLPIDEKNFLADLATIADEILQGSEIRFLKFFCKEL